MAASAGIIQDTIYGTALFPNPNHQTWLGLGLTTGVDWLTHHLDHMLPAVETQYLTIKIPNHEQPTNQQFI